MSFSLDIGKNKILKYNFERMDFFDPEQLDALYNTNSERLVEVQKIFRDGEIILEYDITEYLGLKDYIRRLIEKREYNVEKASAILIELVDLLREISNYLSLTVDNILLSLEYVFWDIRESKMKWIYIPKSNIDTNLNENLMNLIRDFELISGDNSEVIAFFVVQMNYLREHPFHLEEFKKNILKQSQKSSPRSQAGIREASMPEKKEAHAPIPQKQEPPLRQESYRQEPLQNSFSSMEKKSPSNMSMEFQKNSLQQNENVDIEVPTPSKNKRKGGGNNIRILILFNMIFLIAGYGISTMLFSQDGEMDFTKVAALILILLVVGNYILFKMGFFKKGNSQDLNEVQNNDKVSVKKEKTSKKKNQKEKKVPPIKNKDQMPSFMKNKEAQPPKISIVAKEESILEPSCGAMQNSRVEVVDRKEANYYIQEKNESSYEEMGGTQFISEDQGTQFINVSSSPSSASLYMNSKKQTFPLKYFPCIVGRVKGKSDIVVPISSVSGAHIRIEEHGGSYYVIDLGSKNGTSINGMRINSNEMYPIKDGDSILLSNEGLTFRING